MGRVVGGEAVGVEGRRCGGCGGVRRCGTFLGDAIVVTYDIRMLGVLFVCAHDVDTGSNVVAVSLYRVSFTPCCR